MASVRPNFLLITCHDLGRHLGCYGVRTVHTPNLDRLAAEGVRFTNAFCTAPQCSPSRAALATGRYPHSNGVMGLTHPPFGWDLHPDERHLAQILGSAGYETHLFGFQHVSPDPARLGFDHLHGFDRAIACHEDKALGMNVARRLSDFLGGLEAAHPLYIEANLEEPHRPYDQGGVSPDDSLGVYVPPYLPDGPAARKEMAELQGAIRQADEAVGGILTALDEAGMSDNTLVIFCADHGLAMPRAKCTLYDPGIEIALLMRWPAGGLAGSRTVPSMVSNVDILPTVLKAAGVDMPENVQGQSLLAAARGQTISARTAVFAEKTFHSYYDPMRAIRTDRFKYIRNFEAAFAVEVPGDVQMGAIFREFVQLYHSGEHVPEELYDLAADPLEQDNLADDAAWTNVRVDLAARLHAWMKETDDPLLDGPVASPAYRNAIR